MGEPKNGFSWTKTIRNIGIGLAEPEDLLKLYLRQAMVKKPMIPLIPSEPTAAQPTRALPGSTIGLKPTPGSEGLPQIINMPDLGGK